MKKGPYILLFCLLVVLSSSMSYAVILSSFDKMNITKDTYLYSGGKALNYGAKTTIIFDSSTYVSLIDPQYSLPANTTIYQANLSLFKSSGSTTATLSLFPMLKSWEQGTGTGVTNSGAINGSTWLERWYGDNLNNDGCAGPTDIDWCGNGTTYGTDYSEAVSSIRTSAGSWNIFDITAVLSWQANNSIWYGYRLSSNEVTDEAFSSSDSSTETRWPAMNVSYFYIGPRVTTNSPANNSVSSASTFTLNFTVDMGGRDSYAAPDNTTNCYLCYDAECNEYNYLSPTIASGLASAGYNVTYNVTFDMNALSLGYGAYTMLCEAGVSYESTPYYGSVYVSSWPILNTFYYDGEPTLLTIDSPINGANYSSSTVTLDYTFSDLTTSTCYINATGTNISSVCSNDLSYVRTPPQGYNTWFIYTNDSAGNVAAYNVTFFHDSITPLVSILQPSNATPFNNKQVTINYTWSESNIRSCWYSNSSGAINYSISCTSNITRNWSEGSNTVWLYVNDTSGNLNKTSVTFNIDTTAPRPTILTPVNGTNYSYRQIQINYTWAEANIDDCWWSNNSGVTNNTISCTSNITANWSEGNTTLWLYTNDTYGNFNFTNVVFRTDTIWPTVSFVNPSINNTNFSATQVIVNFTWNDALPSQCWYSNSSGLINYSFSCTSNITKNWTEGPNQITISMNDSVGHLNSTTLWLTVDTQYPNISIIYPLARNYTSIISVINYTVADLTLNRCWNNATGSNSTPASCLNYTGLSSSVGWNTWAVSVNDSFNRVNTSIVTFFVDTTAPVVTIQAPTNNTNYSTRNITINFTWTETNPRSCWWSNTTGATNTTLANCSINISALWSENTNRIFIFMNDTSGNLGQSTINFTTDTIDPTISIVHPASSGAWYNKTNLTINYTSQDTHRSTCWWTNNSGSTNNTISCTTNISANWPNSSNTVIIYVNDTFGRSGNATAYFNIDNTAPFIEWNRTFPGNMTAVSTNMIHFRVNYTENNLASFTYYWARYPVAGSCLSDHTSAGGTSPTLNQSNVDGDFIYRVCAKITDSAGNYNYTEERLIVMDRAYPNTTVTYPLNGSYTSPPTSFVTTANDILSGLSTCWWSNNSYVTNTTFTCNSTIITTAVEGSNIWYYCANDSANNINCTTLQFYVDSRAPLLSITAPANLSNWSYQNITVNYTWSDGNIDDCWWSNNSGITNNSISCTSNITQLWAEGLTTLWVYANDTQNNLNKTSINFRVDTLYPVPSISTPSNVSYSALQTQLISTAYDTGVGVFNCWWSNDTYLTNRSFTCNTTVSTSSPQGSNIWRVCANDSLAHINCTNIQFWVDTVYPQVAVLAPINGSNYPTTTVQINYTFTETSPDDCWWSNDSGVTNNSVACNSNISQSWSEGVNNVWLYMNDTVGNMNKTNVTFRVDTRSPVLSIIAPTNGSFAVDKTIFNTTAYDTGLGVQACWWSNDSYATNITFPCNTSITNTSSRDGSNIWYFCANDSFNNRNCTSVQFWVDTVYPQVAILAPANGSNHAAQNIIINYTITESYIDDCWWSNNSGVTNNSLASCNTNISGFNWAEGVTNLWVYVNDTVGNINKSNVTFRVDTLYPTININRPSNQTYNTVQTNFSTTIADSGAGLSSCWWSNNTYITNITFPCNTDITNTSSPQGSSTWRICANDTLNHINCTSVQFWVDSVYPTLSVLTPTNNTNWTYRQIQLNYTWTEANPDDCWWSNNSGANNNSISCTSNLTQNWSDGINTVIFYMNDTINNQNSTRVTFRVDTVAPTVSILAPTNTTYSTAPSLFNATATDALLGLWGCWWSNNSFVTNRSITCNSSISTFNSTQGSNVIYFCANDTAGNIACSNVTYSLDSIYPIPTIQAPVNNTNWSYNSIIVNYTWTEANPDDCWWSNNSGVTNNSVSCTSNISSSWAEGTTNIWFYMNDTLGNFNKTSVTFRVDTLYPTISISYPYNTTYNATQTTFLTNASDTGLGLSTCWWSNDTYVTNRSFTCNSSVTTSSPEGNNIWRVCTNDTQNHVNCTSVQFFVDSIIPNVTIISPLPNASFSDPNIKINYTWVEANVFNCWWSKNGGVTNNSISCTSNITQTWDEGVNNVRIWVNDTTNHINSSNVTFVVDTTGPIVSISYPANTSYNITSLSLNSSVYDAGASGISQCWWSNNSFTSNRTFTCNQTTLNMNATVGSNTWHVCANDTANSIRCTNVTFQVDLTTPWVSIISPANGSSYPTKSISINYTYSESNAQYCKWTNGSGVYTYFTCGQNISTQTWNEGLNNVNVSITDYAGNENITSVTFRSDTIVPSITITQPANQTYNSVKTTLSSSLSDGGSGLNTCWWSNDTYVTNRTFTCNTDITTSSPEGNNIWYICANDSVNNKNCSSVQFKVDLTNPQITILAPLNKSNYTFAAVSINFTWSDANLDKIWWTNDSGANNRTITSNITNASWNEGYNNITFYINDTAGRSNSTHLSFYVDTVYPRITVTAPANTSYNSVITQIVSNVSDIGVGVSTCWFSNDSYATNNTFTCGSATGVTSPQGVSTYYVCVNDTAGNRNCTSVLFFVDSISPTLTITAPTAGQIFNYTSIKLNFTHTELNPDTCWYSNNSGITNRSMPCTSNLTQTWDEGINNVWLYMNDTRGNFNKTNITFRVDTLFPTVSISTPSNTSYNTIQTSLTSTVSDSGVGLSTCWWSNDTYVTNRTFTCNSTVSTSSPQGSSTWYVCVNDTLNHYNCTSVQFYVDSIYPGVNILSPVTGTNYPYREITVNYTFSELNPNNCWWTNNSGVTNNTVACNSNITANWSEGITNLRIYVNDSFGNVNSSNVTFRADTTIPNITITAPQNTSYTALRTSFNTTVYDTGAGISTCWYSTNALVTNTTYSCNASISGLNSGQGTSTWFACVNDTVGNSACANTTFYVDSIAPMLTILGPSNLSNHSSANVSINITYSDLNIDKIWWTNNSGVTNNTITSNISAIWPEGVNNVKIYANDTYGNMNTTLIQFRVDTTIPVLNLISPSNTTYTSYVTVINTTVSDSGSGVGSCWYSLDNYVTNTTFTCNTPVTGLGGGEGSKIWKVCVNDTVNNQNCTSVQFFVDVAIPTVTILSPYSYTNFGYKNIPITYTWSETNLGSIWWTNNSGITNHTISTNISGYNWQEGNNTVTIYINDTVGKVGNSSVYFYIDTLYPTVSISQPLNISYASVFTTFSTAVSDAGLGLFNCWWSNDTYVTNRSFICNSTISTAAKQGSNTWYVCANDSMAHINCTSVTFFTDSIKPTINILYPSNASSFTSSQVDINFTFTETNPDTIWWSNNSGATPTQTTTNITGLSWHDGSNTIIIYMNDSVNNTNSTSVTFTIDTGLPNVTISSPSNATYTNASIRLNMSSYDTLSPISLCWWSNDSYVTNYSIACNSSITSINASQGSNTIFVCTNDTAGNIGCGNVTFGVDSIAPSINVTAPTNGTNFSTRSPIINFTWYEANPGSCWYSTNGGNNNYSMSCTSNLTTTYIEGVTNLMVSMNDTLGNIGSYTIWFKADTIAPTITISQPANASFKDFYNYTVQLAANASDGSGVGVQNLSYSLNGGTRTLFTTNTNVSGLVAGGNTITVYANDSVNNTNSTTISLSLAFTPKVNEINVSNGTIYSTNLSNGLVRYYKFDKNYTIQQDSSESNVVGNVTSGALFTSAGLVSGAYFFDGIDSKVLASIPNMTSFTIDLWINPIAYLPNGNYSGIIVPPGGQSKFNINYDYNGALTVQYRNATSTTQSFTSFQLGLNKWQHLTLRYNTTNWIMNLDNSSTIISLAAAFQNISFIATNVSIGHDEWNSRTFNSVNGSIDEFRVYNRSLSDLEVAALGAVTKPQFQEKPTVDINLSILDEDSTILTYNWTVNGTQVQYGINNNTLSRVYLEPSANVSILITDESGNTITQNITVNTTIAYPALTILYPNTTRYSTNVTTLNFTYTELNPDKCWYYNGTMNSTPAACANITGIKPVAGYNYWTLYMNDTSNHLNQTNFTFYLDSMAPYYTTNRNNASATNTKKNTVVQWDSYFFDNIELDAYIFSQNMSGSWSNATPVDITGASMNLTNSTNITAPRGWNVCGKFYVNDTYGLENVTNTSCFTVQNTAPSFNMTFANFTLYHTQDLVFDVNCTDIDNDTIIYYVNNSIVSINSSTGNITDNATASEYGNYSILVTCGDSYGNITNSFLYNIINNVPSVSSVNITPVVATIAMNLTCNNGTVSDPENDTVTLLYNWYRNGTSIGQNTSLLTSGNLSNGNTYMCDITPYDRARNGTTISSNNVFVSAVPIYSPTINWTNATITTTGLNATSSNPVDNDSWLNLSVTFFANTTGYHTAWFCKSGTDEDGCIGGYYCLSELNSSVTPTLSCRVNMSGLTSLSYNYYVFVGSNNSLHSATTSNTFYINYPPTAPNVTTPQNDTYTANTTIFLNFSSIDPNSDNVTYTIYNSTDDSNYTFLTNVTGNVGYNWSNAPVRKNYVKAKSTDSRGLSLGINGTKKQFVIDTEKPTLILSRPTNILYTDTNLRMTLDANDTNINYCNFSLYYQTTPAYANLAGEGQVACTSDVYFSPPDDKQNYTLIVSAFDLAGNSNYTEVNFTLDTSLAPSGSTGGGGAGGTTTVITSNESIAQAVTQKLSEAPICGNSVCQSGETPLNCPSDCPINVDELFCVFGSKEKCPAWAFNWMIYFIVGSVMFVNYIRIPRMRRKK